MPQHECRKKNTSLAILLFFYNMMNIANVNPYVIYCHNVIKTHGNNQKPLSRHNFMLELHTQLVSEWHQKRARNGNIRRAVRAMASGQSSSSVQDVVYEQTGQRKYCQECSYQKRRYTTVCCVMCNKPICGQHQKKVCYNH